MARKKHSDEAVPVAADDDGAREVAAAEKTGERAWQAALRPRTFDEYIGQRDLIDNLRVSVRAAKDNGWTLDHFLFAGPPGLGKTTLAHVIANELGVNLHVSSGPAIDHKGMLASLLTSLGEGDALFIDEIHRLSPVVEENLYPAMEDFRFDYFIGDGPHAKSMMMQLPRFTLLGATTRMGLLSAPLLDRFGFHWQLRYYELPDMTAIVKRSAQLIGITVDNAGAIEIARRARGTPRIANRLLRRVRDFAAVERDGAIDGDIASSSLDRLAVDHAGLDALDRGYLQVICERFDGGPVGIEAVAASLSEERGTLEEVVEPFLLSVGFIARTPRGRVATAAGFQHLGLAPPAKAPTGGQSGTQGRLF
jgi:Holliday junction DNA helicase RuvB